MLGLEFEEAKKFFTEKKREVAKAAQDVQAAAKQLEPLQVLLKEQLNRKGKRAANHEKAERNLRRFGIGVRDGHRDIHDAGKEAERVQKELQSLQEKEKRRLTRIEDLQTKKRHYEAVLREPQRDVTDRIAEKNRERVST